MAVKVKELVIGEGRPKICVPLTPKGEKELQEQLEHIKKACADMLEWRVDFWEKAESEKSRKTALGMIQQAFPQLPLLFTFRTKEEGGEREISEEDYEKLAEWALEEENISLLDLELFCKREALERLIKKAGKTKTAVLLSSHDFAKTPPEKELIERLLAMERLGADILKLAVMPQTEEDVLTLLGVTQKMKRLTDKPVITMSMGKLGIVSRVAGGVFGSAVTFGTAGKASAPGQIEATKLLDFLEIFQ